MNRTLSSHSIQLLDRALTTLRDQGERHATHAMLVANSKLLSLFSMYAFSAYLICIKNTFNLILLFTPEYVSFTVLVYFIHLLRIFIFRKHSTSLKSSDQMMLILLANLLFANEENNTSNICSLAPRESRLKSSSSIPVKIGSASSIRSSVRERFADVPEDSSSDLEVSCVVMTALRFNIVVADIEFLSRCF